MVFKRKYSDFAHKKIDFGKVIKYVLEDFGILYFSKIYKSNRFKYI